MNQKQLFRPFIIHLYDTSSDEYDLFFFRLNQITDDIFFIFDLSQLF